MSKYTPAPTKRKKTDKKTLKTEKHNLKYKLTKVH